MNLTQYIGDSITHEIALEWGGEAFEPGDAWSFIFTAKRNEWDTDDEAVIQKETGSGITISGSTASVAIVPDDTNEVSPKILVWDIQGQHLTTGEIRTVASGSLNLKRDISRETTTSIPVITEEPPSYAEQVAGAINNSDEATTLGNTDKFGITVAGVLKWISWSNIIAAITIGWNKITGGTANHIPFNTSPTSVPTTEGTVSWNADDHTLDIQTEVANTKIQVGQENVIRVRNSTGATLTDGTVVYITGATGQRATIAKAVASNASHVRATIGLVTSDIANNSNGYVTTQGLVRGVNTSAFAEGAVLYLSDVTAGAITDTAPTANDMVRIGWCVVSGVNGTILVSVRRLSVSASDIIDPENVVTNAAVDSAGAAMTETTFSAKKSMGTIGFQSQPNASDTTTIGSVTYTWVSGTPAAPNQVQIAGTSILSANNLRNAVNSGSGGGTAHPTFTATSANGILGLLAKTVGSAGNGHALTTDGTRLVAYSETTYGGTDAVQTLSVEDRFRDDHAYENPLVIPTPDGLAAVTHPGVVFLPNGWNGYRYWMAFTPWPDGSREFPNIIASQNGVDWEVPAGLTNPIIGQATVAATPSGGATPFGFAPDTHLVMLDDNTMACFFLMAWAGGGSSQDAAMFRMTSTDGVTWGNLTRCIDTVANGRNAAHGITSPAVFQMPDGTWEMFGVTEFDGDFNRISRWTSPDTTTWTYQNQLVIPYGSGEPWHLDAHYVSGKYHVLYSAVGGRYHYLYSTDGVNFYGDTTNYVPELVSGADWDGQRSYRASMVPRYGNPLKWDVWASGLPTAPLDGVQAGGKPWTIGLFRGVEFKDITPSTQYQNTRILMPLASGMTYNGGTGSAAALRDATMFQLGQGSTAGGYALARLSRRTTTRESDYTNYSRPFEITGKFVGGAAAGSMIRILYGHSLNMDSGFAANAGSNPFTEKGIGIEFSATGGNQLARIVYHNGTTAAVSSWADLGHTAFYIRTVAYRLVNQGNGTIQLYVAGGGSTALPKVLLPSTPSVSVTNGPTGQGATANNCAIWAVVTGDGTTTPGTVQAEFEAPRLEWK